MSRRPSLADTMRAVAAKPAPSPVSVKETTSKAPAPLREDGGERKAFFAATREGLKRITVAVAPEEHKRLKRLSVDEGRSIEDLMREALADLFAKRA